MRKAIVWTLALSWIAQPSFGGQDWWLKAPLRTENSLELPCEGLGPSRDIALKEAIKQCVSMATDQIVGDYNVKSLTVETEKDASYHEEITANRSVEGLTCSIKREETTEDDGSYDTWLLCNFNLEKIKFTWFKPKEAGRYITSEDKSIIFATVPPCDSILITGKSPRIIECKSNPMEFLQKKGDQEYIIRANGYLPKHISPNQIKSDIEEVYLERE